MLSFCRAGRRRVRRGSRKLESNLLSPKTQTTSSPSRGSRNCDSADQVDSPRNAPADGARVGLRRPPAKMLERCDASRVGVRHPEYNESQKNAPARQLLGSPPSRAVRESAWWWTQSNSNRSPQPDSLLTGKNTGNCARFGVFADDAGPFPPPDQRLTREFPVSPNREFQSFEQGIQLKDQGSGGRDIEISCR